ncbi:MAG TPA: hypothetical protein VFU15_12415 [Bacteroidia bacterium]|nr:hypothetical protein [Bacteroidia bacterium]
MKNGSAHFLFAAILFSCSCSTKGKKITGNAAATDSLIVEKQEYYAGGKIRSDEGHCHVRFDSLQFDRFMRQYDSSGVVSFIHFSGNRNWMATVDLFPTGR